ncbi:hypothetical protein [Streptomyces sp. NPDC051286]|uniref:hypothetical protein n=1 Tax=Streptomyces sp. NPDC051286 TaxID=3365647 RepID=UPI0037AF8AB1
MATDLPAFRTPRCGAIDQAQDADERLAGPRRPVPGAGTARARRLITGLLPVL